MPKKTLRKCTSCHILIEVCDKTPITVRRFCTACIAQKLEQGCVICGDYAGKRKYLDWYQGDFYCSRHLNPVYPLDGLQTRTCSSLGMNVI